MLLTVLVILAYVIFATLTIFRHIVIADFFTTIIINVILFFVVSIWAGIHLSRYATRGIRAQQRAQKAAQRAAMKAARSAPQPTGPYFPEPAPDPRRLSFRVAGVTFDNEDGKSRQDILRHLRFGDRPYAEHEGDLNLTIQKTTFQGETALAVLINGYQVGFVPKNMISEVEHALRQTTFQVTHVDIYGGGTLPDGSPCSWGCEVFIRF